MSWEECGLVPGKIDGPEKCPKGACSDCDGAHHFYIDTVDADPAETCTGESVDFQFTCKHCAATAEALDDDGEEEEEPIDVDYNEFG
jgi:hypothetical protein